MLRANLVSSGKISLEEVKIPKADAGKVLIEVKVCGICGSDIHTYKGTNVFTHPPVVLGHEFSGIVSEIDSGAKNFKKGERVTVEPNVVCGKCYNCRNGRYNICRDAKVIGGGDYDGAFAEYIVVPEDRVLKLGDETGLEEAALIEPTAVAVHAVRMSGERIGDRVAVLGAGSIGLLVMQLARLTGAREIVVTDLLDYRLEKALELGADQVINPNCVNVVEVVRKDYGAEGIDLVYDCVGTERTIFEAIQMARKGTKIILVGIPEKRIGVDLALVNDRELELIGSMMYVRKDFLTAKDLIESGKVKVKPLVTHYFKLKEVEQAFELLLSGKDGVIKVLLKT